MGKKLITVGNYREHICGDKFFVTSDVIVTPGAKDKLRAEGIELVYGEKKCCSNGNNINKNGIEEKVVEILVKDFNITDSEVIAKILSKVKDLI